ncbi:MAG: DEAD/DEAH box helicase [Nitrososphaeria archaeon]
MIPAARAWKDGGARERLLADLGKASRLCRPIETSLRESPEPHAAIMGTDQAYSFLKSDAWLLRESGFDVFVPAMERSRPKMRVTVKTESTGFLGLRSVARFEWNVAIGDSVISMEEFMKLASLKQQLVYIKGKWVELGDINNIMKIVEKSKNGIRVDEAIKLATEGDEYVESVTGEGALKGMLKAIKTKASLEMLPQPAELRAILRPYQLHGYSWLTFMAGIGLGAILADDMGLGKTPQAIAFLTRRNGPSLVVVPTSIVGNWKREIERFAPLLSVMVHHGSERLSGKKLMEEAMKHNIVISTYSLLSRDIDDLSAVKWDTVVLDEAQNIKNHWTKQAQAARKLTARFRVALTGTPVENRLSELWSIMDFLNPGYLGSLKEFSTKYAIPVERYGEPVKSEVLHRLVEPFIMRRLKTDKSIIQDLPEKMESNVLVNLTVEQATLYQGVVDEMMERIASSDGMQRKGLILSTLTRLKQVCDHPSLFLSEKGQRLSGRSASLTGSRKCLRRQLRAGAGPLCSRSTWKWVRC